jgi:restriction system protein
MDEASRSNPQNVAEGFTQESLKGYIYLAGIARGSNEELQQDYRNFLIQKGYQVWSMNHQKIPEFREFRVKWISPTTLNTPTLPGNPEEAANMLLTFCQMEGVLLRKLVESLLAKHEKEGGLTERLYRKRKEYRRW